MVSGRQVESGSGPIRYGMVGGGQGAFIGAVHRIAARMDNEFELVAGALSSDPKRARASAEELGLDPDRSYGSYAEMARAEAKWPDGIEAVAIVTPNNVHVPAAMAFWYAAPLIMWQQMPLGKALFYSFFAVRRAGRAFLVYGLAWIVIAIVVPTVISMIIALVSGSFTVVFFILLPISIMLTVVMYCSFYPTYTSVFGKPRRGPDSPHPGDNPAA